MAVITGAEVKSLIDKIRVDFSKKGGKHLKIKNKFIFKDFTIQINPAAIATPYIEDIKTDELKQYAKETGFFVRDDLVAEVADVLFPKKEFHEILSRMKEFISEEDYGALAYAAHICKEEDNKRKTKEHMSNITSAYGPTGHTLYNWLRCSEVFQQDVFPMLDFLGKHYSGNVMDMFSLHWENLKKFHPTKIFVSIWKQEEDLMDAILKRLLIHNMKQIHVYTRGGRIRFADRIINRKMKYELRDYKVTMEEYELGTTKAKKFTITKKG